MKKPIITDRRSWLKTLKDFPMIYVDAIIKIGNGKVLLGRRKYPPLKGQLCTIGGRVYRNESLKDAAIRKIKEETGLKTRLIGIIDISQQSFTKGQSRHCVDFMWLAEKTGGRIKTDNQHSEFVIIDKMDNTLAKFIRHALKVSKVFDNGEPNIIDVPFFIEE